MTGKLGVCIASNGPGVANMLSGVAVENAEGNRVLAITSCRRPQIVYPDRGGAYQAFDQVGAIKHFAKWSKRSSRSIASPRSAVPPSLLGGRPGVAPGALMIMNGRADVAIWQRRSATRALGTSGGRRSPTCWRQPTSIIAARRDSRGGLRRPSRRQLLNAPVTTSWAARGVLPETSELAIPMPLIKLNHEVRNDADLVLVVGSRLGETDWWGKAPYWRHPSEQRMIQVDIDGHVVGANKPRH
jgi:acetolactate synthase-1/2/3 large subunit